MSNSISIFDFFLSISSSKIGLIALDPCVKEARPKEWQEDLDSGSKKF